MALDLEKLRKEQNRIFKEAVIEYNNELPTTLVHLTNSKDLNQFLQGTKFNASSDVTARVLNSWIDKKLVHVEDEDAGKIKRFSRLENIWIRIITQARKFGLSLGSLENARKELFLSPVENFNLLKYGILLHIFDVPQILIMTEDGHIRMLPADTYHKWLSENKLPFHLTFNLSEFLGEEFPKNEFGTDLGLQNLFDNTNALKLLFFLKTGEYDSIKVYVNEFDVREITKTEQLLKNVSLIEIINNWSLEKIEIYLDGGSNKIVIRDGND